MIGEVRDHQSATTAARAGLSGQLVMATLHARHPGMAIDALTNMEVPRYVIGGALRLIIQQNLVLRVCQKCAREVELTGAARELFQAHQVPVPDTVREAAGCPECGNYGHQGRIAVFELTPIDRALGQDIAAGLGTKELAPRFQERCRQSMQQDILHKVADGLVAFDTAQRLLQSLDDSD
jgi:type II secretory ATPase GspE/PulE/Tfp pilus assembly ATPase PilB-like protein